MRTQQIIAGETGVTAVADPLGGSVYVEELTARIEQEADAYLERIDALGGAVQAIESGYIQAEIQNAAYRYQRGIEQEEIVVVGVNRFRAAAKDNVPAFKLDPALEQSQIERLREVRASRNASEAHSRLNALESAARSGDNLMPHVLNCVETYCSVGEISDRLRRVFGEYGGAAS